MHEAAAGRVRRLSSATIIRDRAQLLGPVRAVPSGGPWLIPVAIAMVYLGSPVSPWWVLGAVGILAAVAGAYALVGDRGRAVFAAACVVAFAPAIFGWSIATPGIGAVLLVAYTLRIRGRRAVIGRTVPVTATIVAAVVCAGVAVFQHVTLASAAGTIGWTSLPGQNAGFPVVLIIVLAASATNATFEELLWRIGIDGLFTSRQHLLLRSVFISALFGLSHIHGTPSGVLGMTFAGLFGLTMCLVRDTSRGAVLWVIAAHFVADVILIGGAYGLFVW